MKYALAFAAGAVIGFVVGARSAVNTVERLVDGYSDPNNAWNRLSRQPRRPYANDEFD